LKKIANEGLVDVNTKLIEAKTNVKNLNNELDFLSGRIIRVDIKTRYTSIGTQPSEITVAP
jgi:hypothetical protein